MESPFGQQQAQLDTSKLSDLDKLEIRQSLESEMQKARIQDATHNLTDICWKKCITGKISEGNLTNKEERCAQDCVERFMDTSESVIRHLTSMRGQGTV